MKNFTALIIMIVSNISFNNNYMIFINNNVNEVNLLFINFKMLTE